MRESADNKPCWKDNLKNIVFISNDKKGGKISVQESVAAGWQIILRNIPYKLAFVCLGTWVLGNSHYGQNWP